MPLDRSQSKVFASLTITASSSSSVGTHYIRSISINFSLSPLISAHLPDLLCRTDGYSQNISIGKISLFEILLHFSDSLSHCLYLSRDSLHSHVPHFRTSHRYLYCICAYLDRSCWLLVSKEYLKLIYSTKIYSMLFYDLINTDVYLAP